MKAAGKVALWIAASVTFLISLVALFSSATDCYIYRNHAKYVQEDFIISGTRMVASAGDDGTDYYLQGSSGSQVYEFAIDSSDYGKYSSPAMIGKAIQVFRHPELFSIAVQKRSLNVIFAEEWSDLDGLEVSARSTLWIGLFSLLLSCAFYLVAKLAFPPLTSQAERD